MIHPAKQTSKIAWTKKQTSALFFSPRIIAFMLLLFSMMYCQYPYENDDLMAGKRIIVVEAYLDNWDGPHEVTIHYARPYNAAKAEPIQGANVYITDSRGNQYQYYEVNDEKGKYITEKGELTGVIGETYQLHVVMPDGQRILSEPSVIPPPIEVDTGFYLGSYRWKELVEDVSGTPIIANKLGQGVFAVIKNIPQGVAYYRISSEPIIENISRTLDTLFTYYEIDSLKREFAIWDHHHHYRVLKPTKALHIGRLVAGENYSREELTINAFRTERMSPDGIAVTGEHYKLIWIIPFRIHAITPELYQFYEDQIAQLDAPERIYDPIPRQLAGNLYLEADRNQPVLGMFETSSAGRMNMTLELLVWRTLYGSIIPIMLPDTTTLPRKTSYKRGVRIGEIYWN
jgi:hypothetical protein